MTDMKILEMAKFAAQVAKKAGANDARSQVLRTREVVVEWRDGKLDRIRESTKQGLSITLFVDGRYSSNSTSDIRDAAVEEYVKSAVATTRYLSADEHRRLPDPTRYDDVTTADLQLKDPALGSVTPENRLNLAKELEEATRAGDGQKQIISVTATVGDEESRSAIFNTNGFEGEQEDSAFWQVAEVSVKDTADRKPEGYSYGVKRFRGELQPAAEVGKEALKRALDQLGSHQAKTGVYDMVMDNRAAARFAMHLLRPLSGGAIQQKRSFLEDKLDKQIASKILTITDNPHIARGLASSAWDDEGMATRIRPVIEKGTLKTFFMDTYYASKLGKDPTTGGPSNLVWSLGKRDADAMVRKLKKGVYVTDFLGGNSNATTGDFSLGIKGFFVENGKIVHPVSEMNIGGNQIDLWKNLAELGSDPWMYGSNMVPSLYFKKVQFSGSKS